MARALFHILVGWILLTSLPMVSFAAQAEDCESEGEVNATCNGWECKGVKHKTVYANGRIIDIYEGYCKDPEHPEQVVCWGAVSDEKGNVAGIFFVLPAGPAGTLWGNFLGDSMDNGTGEVEVWVDPPGVTARATVNLDSQPSDDEKKDSCACSQFLKERPIEYYDPPHDHVLHGQPSQTELDRTDVFLARVDQKRSAWITIELYGLIPSSPNGSLDCKFLFDTDGDKDTGNRIGNLGVEFTVWAGYNPPFAPGDQWAVALFRVNDVGGFDLVRLLQDEEWDIRENYISVRIPLSEMGNPLALRFRSFMAMGSAADWVPNEGFGFWIDTQEF